MATDRLTAELVKNLAANLHYVRDRRGLTQTRLAELCGIPRSTLANLETGTGNPTLTVLARLAGALQLSISELLSAPTGMGRLYPAGSLPTVTKGFPRQAKIRKLLPDPIPGMEIDRMEIPAGTRVPGVPHRPGTREYLYCERGSIVLFTAGQRFALTPGDVCSFHGDQPHSYSNDGDDTAILVGVVALAPM